ncbi:hypothetical protein Pint_06160 [Pistacia integerrima]|uniref:Uncharacterized protein n=1 Tax=Pistacia integerrima TaxID=434235 RepID=A0ACC0Z5P6_9ROSI|nr:hypothetical protein Pint_06160 [Pistacia integerrima]
MWSNYFHCSSPYLSRRRGAMDMETGICDVTVCCAALLYYFVYHHIKCQCIKDRGNFGKLVLTELKLLCYFDFGCVVVWCIISFNQLFGACICKQAAFKGAKLLCFLENFSYVGANDEDNLKVAEPLDGPIMRRYCSLARESGICLSLGGFQEKKTDDAHLSNTHVVIDDVGNIRSTYRKIHFLIWTFPVKSLTRKVALQKQVLLSGKNVEAVDSPFGRLGLTVCYDLRFPELYQQLRFQYEAQVIGASQAGKHNDERESYGDSLIIDPWGEVIGRLADRLSTGIAVADIDFSLIDSVRSKMPIAKLASLSYLVPVIFLPNSLGFSTGSRLTSGSLHLYDFPRLSDPPAAISQTGVC